MSSTQDIMRELGATSTADHTLRVYVPSHDCYGAPLVDQASWVELVSRTLASLAGGVTVAPAVRGGWLNGETGQMVYESPVVVLAYLTHAQLRAALPEVRALLHRMGRETNQGAIGFELDGQFAMIETYDTEGVAA